MTKRSRIDRGFTLLEFLIVVGIVMIVSMIALPGFTAAISNTRLRSSMTSLSGVLQSTRMLAVKQNRTMTTRIAAQPAGIIAHAKRAIDTEALDIHDQQIEMEAPITQVTTLSGPGVPTALDVDVLGFTPQAGNPSFSALGMPCAYSLGTCPNFGFRYYFHDARTGDQMGWAALSISPAGRIKEWFWTGTSWVD